VKKGLYVIVDGAPGSEDARFVGLRNERGEKLRGLSWVELADGTWAGGPLGTPRSVEVVEYPEGVPIPAGDVQNMGEMT